MLMRPVIQKVSWSAVGCVVLLSGLGIAGCATTSRYVVSEEREQPPVLSVKASNKHLVAMVNHFLLPNGSGAWVKDAPWQEVIFTVKNTSGSKLQIHEIALVLENGQWVQQGKSAEELVKIHREREEKAWHHMAVTGPATMGAAIAASLISPLVAMPVLLYGAYTQMSGFAETKREGVTIEDEFKRRQVQSGVLSPRGSLLGSAFFTLGASPPKEVVLSYEVNGRKADLHVPLDHKAIERAAGHSNSAGKEAK